MKPSKLLTLGLLGGSASFSPLSIPGLALWLDANDSTTLFQDTSATTPTAADGQAVGRWNDKSGNGKNPIQATANRKPLRKDSILNGGIAVLFDGLTDGTGDVLQITAASFARTQPQTMYVVFQLVVPTTTNYVFGSGTDPGNYAVFAPGTATTMRMNSGVSLEYTLAGWDVFAIWCFEFNGATSKIFKAGAMVKSGDAGTNAQGGLTIGANPYLANSSCANMYLTDMLIFSGILSDANRNAVGSWLAAKTGLDFTPA